jgi:hypothetical protein
MGGVDWHHPALAAPCPIAFLESVKIDPPPPRAGAPPGPGSSGILAPGGAWALTEALTARWSGLLTTCEGRGEGRGRPPAGESGPSAWRSRAISASDRSQEGPSGGRAGRQPDQTEGGGRLFTC